MNRFASSVSRRCIRAAILPLSIMLLLPAISLADPIHDHCATEPWMRTLNNPPFQFEETGTRTNLIFPNLNIPAQPPMKANCVYETSDITQIDITLTFGGVIPMAAASANATSTADPGGATPNPNGPFVFNSGLPTSLTFNAHSNSAANVLHITLPGGGFGLTLNDVTGPMGIANVKLDFSGTHYYVPEPTAAAIATLASLMALCHLRCRPKTDT
jgi:hypothetical protein